MYYLLYKVTNKINGKIYVGVHKTKNINDGYMGSGKLLKRAIEKYGIENFEKEILKTFANSENMFDAESALVNESFVDRDDTYNLKQGGLGGWDVANKPGRILSDLELETKRRNGMVGIRKINYQFKCNKEFRTRVLQSKSKAFSKYYLTHNGMFKHKRHTQESKNKIGKSSSKHQSGSGNSQYGTMWIHSLELKQSKRISKDDRIPEGWIKGRKIKF